MAKVLHIKGNKEFSKVLHLADIHIRLYKRHQEYRFVFEELYKSIQSWKNKNTNENACIVICGDLVHAKTDMSPEMVDLLSDFLLSLSKIYPVVIIAGNHDLNLANPHRLDSLSPIIENLDNENLYYLRESGIYKFGNIEFAVFSVIGSQEDWPDISLMGDSYKVGLYHGLVYNAETDLGYKITSKNVELSRFDGLDVVLLGDIHRYQILQEYSLAERKPAVVYPGSLIQQNHGESLNRHGWIEWDLNSKTHKYYKVKNNNGYVTLVARDDSIEIPNELPENIRLRLFVENLDSTGIKKILSLVKQSCNITEYTVNKTPTSKNGDVTSIVNSQLDVHDVSYQEKLLKEYIEQNYPGTAEEVLEKVFEINKQLNSQVQEEELPKNIHWKPISLKFDNLFSYGAGNYINFENFQGLYGVFSPNATGKTSAFDALCFALYDKTPRAFKGSHIMNTRENECSCEFIFEIGDSRYKIIRRGSRRPNGEVKVDVEFMKKSDNEWTILSGEDRRDTNAVIRSYVGDYEDFVLTNLSVQNQNALFIDKGQSERKDLLSQFMGLTIFDRLFEVASLEIKEVAGSLKTFSNEDFTTQLVEIQQEITNYTKDYDTWISIIHNYKVKIEEINSKIFSLSEKKIPIDVDVIKIDNFLREKKELKSKVATAENSLSSLSNAKLPSAALIKELSDKKIDINPIILEIETLENVPKLLYETTTEVDILNHKLTEWKKQISWLEKHEYDPKCPFCMKNVFVKEAKQAAVLYEENKLQIQSLMYRKEELENKHNKLKELRKIVENQNKIAFQIKEEEKTLLKIDLEIEKLKSSISDIESSIFKCESKIEKYYKNEEAIKENTIIDKKILDEKSELSKYAKKLNEGEKLTQEYNGKIQVLVSKKDDLLRRIEEAEELESMYEAYEYYLAAVCRDGIPYLLMSQTIPTIQTLVNNILSQVVEFSIVLEVDGKNINGNIVYDNSRRWPLELASGMEKFVTGLAIRVALMSISSLPRSNFLILDEGLGVLDSENLSSMFMLFDMLRGEFEFIILISHLEVVRDVADVLLEIKRDNGYSYIYAE